MINLEAIKQEVKVFETKRQEFKEVLREHFNAVSAQIFLEYPQLESFSFKAYTCYFNDGDTCYYTVYSDSYSIYINNERLDDFWGEENKEKIEKLKPIAESIEAFLRLFPDEIILDMFGDHVCVTVNRNPEVGVVIDSYADHD